MRAARSSSAALNRRAAASVEALIALPLLVLLVLALSFAERARTASQAALAGARRCAYEYAVAGCAQLPAACNAAPRSERSAEGRAGAARIVERARATNTSDFDVFEDVPVIGEALAGLFGESARVSQPFELPAAFGRPPQVGHAALTLACNERARSVVHDVEHVFCKHLPVLGCHGGAP